MLSDIVEKLNDVCDWGVLRMDSKKPWESYEVVITGMLTRLKKVIKEEEEYLAGKGK